jgi:hypothetical protein
MGTTIFSFCSHFLRGKQKMSLYLYPHDTIVLTLETTHFQSVESVPFPNKLYYYFLLPSCWMQELR